MLARDKCACMLFCVFLFGVTTAVAQTAPGAIAAPAPSSLGAHLAILNSFNVVGPISANAVVGMGLGNLWKFGPRFMIGSGIAGGEISVVMSWFIIIPSRAIENSDEISYDEESSYGSDHPDSL